MVALCDRNFSIGVYDQTLDEFIELRKHSIHGLIGGILDQLLHRKHRRCTFHPVDRLGDLSSNGSYTGAKKLIYDSEIDVYSRPETVFSYDHEEFIELSQPTNSESLQVTHFIGDAVGSSPTCFDFLIQNLLIIYLIIIGYILTILLILLVFYLSKRKINRYQIRNFIFNLLLLKKTPKRMLIILSFSFFVFFLSIILLNLQSTDSFNVDISEIIYSENQLRRTKKVACWLQTDQDYELAKSSPKHTLLYEIYTNARSTKNFTYRDGRLSNVCDFSPYLDEATFKMHMSFGGITRYFYFMKKTTTTILMVQLTRWFENSIVYQNNENYYEFIMVHYMRKNMKFLEKNYLKTKLLQYFEEGIYIDFFDKFHKRFSALIGEGTKYYTNIQDYIDNYTSIQELQINYFKKLFFIFFVIQMTIFICFIVHCLLNFVKKSIHIRRFL